MHHPRVEVLDAGGRGAGHEDSARLSADRRAAAMADAEDRPRGGGGVRRRARRGLSRPSILQAHDLWPLRQALPQIHFPGDQESLDRARRRLVYQELFILQLALAVRRQQQHDQRKAPALEATAKIDARIRRLFPFELTAGPAAGDCRDRRRHGRPAADEPAVARRRGQRQDGGGRLRHAAGGGPRLPGRADGPHGSARPAARPDARHACWPPARSAARS